jgi:hypothetical protein
VTRKETEDVLWVLSKIDNPDARVTLAKAICEKQLAQFDAMRGQLRDQVDDDYYRWGGR